MRGDSIAWDDNVTAWFHRGSGCYHAGSLPESLLPAVDVSEPGITLAVCTYKRVGCLRRFFDSLLTQNRKPDRLIIVDASPDDETEQMVRNYRTTDGLSNCLLYFRVAGPLKGLTRQRNFGLRWVATDLVAFFDDDIVLLPNCLQEMEQAHRSSDDQIVGVAASMLNDSVGPRLALLWHVRLLLRMVSSLQPGSYCRSGMSIPWGFLGPTEGLVEGHWLQGCAMSWKTEVAREVGFNEFFSGYSNGEDLEFSLRIRAKGILLLAGKAHVLHLDAPGGRPDTNQMAYMNIRNAYYIHRHCLPGRTWKDAAWFLYAYGMDTLIQCANLFWPRRTLRAWEYVKGRLRFFAELPRLEQ